MSRLFLLLALLAIVALSSVHVAAQSDEDGQDPNDNEVGVEDAEDDAEDDGQVTQYDQGFYQNFDDDQDYAMS